MTDNGLKEPSKVRKVITKESIKSVFSSNSSDEPVMTDDTIISLTLPKKQIPKKDTNSERKRYFLRELNPNKKNLTLSKT